MNTTQFALHGIALGEAEHHIKQAGALYGPSMARPPSNLQPGHNLTIDYSDGRRFAGNMSDMFEKGMKATARNVIAPASAAYGTAARLAAPSVGNIMGGGPGSTLGSILGMLMQGGANRGANKMTQYGNEPLSPGAQRYEAINK